MHQLTDSFPLASAAALAPSQFVDPTFCGTTLRANKEIDDVQTFSLKMSLVANTGLRVPQLIGSWAHLLSRDEFADGSLKALRTFRTDLMKHAADVNRRDRIRRFKCQGFNPVKVMSSVAV